MVCKIWHHMQNMTPRAWSMKDSNGPGNKGISIKSIYVPTLSSPPLKKYINLKSYEATNFRACSVSLTPHALFLRTGISFSNVPPPLFVRRFLRVSVPGLVPPAVIRTRIWNESQLSRIRDLTRRYPVSATLLVWLSDLIEEVFRRSSMCATKFYLVPRFFSRHRWVRSCKQADPRVQGNIYEKLERDSFIKFILVPVCLELWIINT
jgi:hypothetical protein